MREAAGLLWCARQRLGWARGAATRPGGSCFLLSCFVSLGWLAAKGAAEEGCCGLCRRLRQEEEEEEGGGGFGLCASQAAAGSCCCWCC